MPHTFRDVAWFLLKRCLASLPTLVGISFLTFLALDAIPHDRAATKTEQSAVIQDAAERAQSLHQLRLRYGLLDPDTGTSYPVHQRYLRWVEHALHFDFAPRGEPPERFRKRFLSALALTAFLGACSMCLAIFIGTRLGTWLGFHRQSGVDRSASSVLLLAYGLPDFLLATLLSGLFCGGFAVAILPGLGLQSPGLENHDLWLRALDFGRHLILPLCVITLGPLVEVTRFVRESVTRSATSESILALRGWGMSQAFLRHRALANGKAPLATLFGSMLPMIITGSVVAENIFALPGIGRLTLDAILEREPATVMATTILIAITTLAGYALSDLLQRFYDPRVGLR